MSQYDIFISYRREGGEQSAKAIYDALKERGYRVFLDVEALRSGAFNTKLYSIIEECADVLVILSPNSLDRCDNREDWVRLEIAHALRCNKNVIPIMLRGFEFPDSMPEEIEAIRMQNGIQSSVEFFDAFIKKLTSFLKSKPTFSRRIFSNASWKKAIIAVAACALLGFGIWGGIQLFSQNQAVSAGYPSTKAQENDVGRLLYVCQNNVTIMDSMMETMESALSDCEDLVLDPQSDSYENLLIDLRGKREQIDVQAKQSMLMPTDLTSNLADTGISIADAEALCNMPSLLRSDFDSSLQFIEKVADPSMILTISDKKKIIGIYKKLLECEKDQVFVGLCQLVRPIKDSSLKSLREEILPSLQVLSTRINLWSKDEVSLKSKEEQIFSQQNLLLNDLAQITGDQNIGLLSEKEVLKNYYISKGYTEEQAQEMVNEALTASQSTQIGGGTTKQQELEAKQKELEEAYQRMREKFAPKEGDDPYLVWGKALRFLSAGMKEDAVAAFEFYLNQMKDSDEYASDYIAAAIRFTNEIDTTGINYGVLVVGYQPGTSKQNVYQIGDIIVALNNVPVKNFEQYQSERGKIDKGKEYTASILRVGGNGHLVVQTIVIPPYQPKTAFMDLVEPNE